MTATRTPGVPGALPATPWNPAAGRVVARGVDRIGRDGLLDEVALLPGPVV